MGHSVLPYILVVGVGQSYLKKEVRMKIMGDDINGYLARYKWIRKDKY